MKKGILFSLLLLPMAILPMICFAKKPCVHDENTFRCVEYIKSRDGDTANFNIPNVHPLIGKNIGIRVLGVDTPETDGKSKCEKKKGEEVKKLVHGFLKSAKRIDLENVGRGSFFRIIADIHFDGKSLTQYLLKNGLAYPYKKGKSPERDWCKPIKKTRFKEKQVQAIKVDGLLPIKNGQR